MSTSSRIDKPGLQQCGPLDASYVSLPRHQHLPPLESESAAQEKFRPIHGHAAVKHEKKSEIRILTRQERQAQ